MRKYFNTVEDRATGRPVAGVTISVLTAPSSSGGTAVTIYSDDGISQITSGLTSDDNGYYEFYVADGKYTLEYAIGGSTLKVISDVDIAQASDIIPDLASTDAGKGAALVWTDQGSTGSIDRTVQSKLRESVSVKDFGAVGDNNTIDVAKFNTAVAAVSAGQTIYFPVGDYLFDNSDTQGPLSTLTLPEGVNILMEGGAWLKREAGGTHNIQAFITCAGNNILQVNIDAGEYPGSMTGTWASDSWGIYGTDAANVTVINSNFRNMAYCIRPVGARNWKIVNCDFYRTKLSAIMFIADADSPAVGNIVQGCTFEDLGDTAVAFLPTVGAEVSFNLVSGNFIKNTQWRTLGCSLDVEGGFAFGFLHDNAFIGNTILHSVATTQGQGAITMGLYSSGGLISGNTCVCTFVDTGTTADTAIFIPRNADMLVEGNRIEGFRGGGVIADAGFRNTIRDNKMLNCGDGTQGAGLYSAILGAWLEGAYGLLVEGNDIAYDNDFPHDGNQTAAVMVNRGDLVTTVDNVVVRGNRVINPAGYGIRMRGNSGGYTLSHISVTGNAIQGRAGEYSTANPISIRYAIGVAFENNEATEVLFGFDLTGSSDGRMAGNTLRNTDIATALALQLDITGVTDFVIEGNTFATAASAKITPTSQITTGGNNVKARYNTGFVTENGGTTAAGVATGGTIAHGLDVTPNSFTAVATDAAATITQIAPGASNLTLTFTGGGTPVFAWSARYI